MDTEHSAISTSDVLRSPVCRVPPARPSRPLLSAVTVLATLLALPSSSAAASCRTEGTTVARSQVARVYAVAPYGDLNACAFRSRRTYYLEDGSSPSGNGNIVRLAGFYVLLDNNPETRERLDAFPTIDVRNLRTGRLRRIKVASDTLATDFVLKDNGSFAEIRYVGGRVQSTEPGVRQVRRFDRRGVRVLAQGVDINVFSLGLRGSVLRWRQEGHVRRATLR